MTFDEGFADRLPLRFGLPPNLWMLPGRLAAPDESGLVGIGADWSPSTLIAAYARGLFPMPIGRRIGWFSPDPRAILPLDALVVSRSLRRSLRRFEITVDTCFAEVMRRCADPRRPHGWITRDVRRAYGALHDLGIAHSVEAWTTDGRLAGGLYGVALGSLFAGESMFHTETDASKVALVHLVERLRLRDGALLDVQWRTAHLSGLGAVEIPRDRYLPLAAEAVRRPDEPWKPTSGSADLR
ncbi:MAG: leucyl/phenylalanyl-tRNA--protein transferase [Microthrixaceae bacterium]